jgi:hypothetical protein
MRSQKVGALSTLVATKMRRSFIYTCTPRARWAVDGLFERCSCRVNAAAFGAREGFIYA